MNDSLSFEFFNRKFKEVLNDNARTRSDVRAQLEATQSPTRSLRRIELSITAMETKFATLREEIWDLVKMELGGSLAHQATTQEVYVAQRIDALHAEFLDVIEEIFESIDDEPVEGGVGPSSAARLGRRAREVARRRRALQAGGE